MNSSDSSTRDRILDSVYNLVSKHPLDQITINDILQDAHVSRPTFYRYFSDKYDAANAVYFRHGRESYSAYTKQKDVAQLLTSFYCIFYEHRNFYNNMLSDIQAQNSFFTFWQQTCRRATCFEINPKKITPEVSIAITMWNHAFIFVGWDLIKGNINCTPEETAMYLVKNMPPVLRDLLQVED